MQVSSPASGKSHVEVGGSCPQLTEAFHEALTEGALRPERRARMREGLGTLLAFAGVAAKAMGAAVA